jgi:hypothetical protein
LFESTVAETIKFSRGAASALTVTARSELPAKTSTRTAGSERASLLKASAGSGAG